MKKVNVKEQVWMVAEKDYDNFDRKTIKYYIETPDHRRHYAFTQSYSNATFDMCKTGIRINDLLRTKSNQTMVMKLVDRTKKMLPYLAEYCEIEKAV